MREAHESAELKALRRRYMANLRNMRRCGGESRAFKDLLRAHLELLRFTIQVMERWEGLQVDFLELAWQLGGSR